MLKELQNNQTTSKINMILGVDEECGTVVRVSNHKTFRNPKFLSLQRLCSIGKLEKILKALKKGIVSEEKINVSVKRILAVKYAYSII